MKKQLLSFAVAALMTLLCAGTIGAEDYQSTYTYIPPSCNAEDYEQELMLSSPLMTIAETEEPVGVDEALEIVRNAMIARESSVTVKVLLEGQAPKEIDNYVKDVLMNHGDNPRGGDYLKFQTRFRSRGLHHNGDPYMTLEFDNITHNTTAEQEAAVDAKVDELVTKWKSMNMTEYQTICTIYNYICDNVVYDREHLNDSSYRAQFTAYAALIEGTSVCHGYAQLFYRLAMEMDIDARMILGDAVGGEKHSWNVVKLGSAYYYLDATWDAGEDTYSYFLKGSDSFDTEHVPEPEAVEILSGYPVSRTDYVFKGEPEDVSGTIGENITWTLTKNGTLTVSGTGDMPELTACEEAPWYIYRERIVKAIFGEGITSISPYALFECSALVSIEIPETVVDIGHHAINHCTRLKEIDLPASIEWIDIAAFEGCTNLKGIYAPEESEHYRTIDGVLYSEDGSILVSYPAGRESLSFIVPDHVEEIYTSAFQYCTLKRITFPNTLLYIDGWAFAHSKALKEISFPSGLAELGWNSFCDIPSLEKVTFNGEIPVVGDNLFDGCSEKLTIYYPINLAGWADVVQTRPDGTLYWQPDRNPAYKMVGYEVLSEEYLDGGIIEHTGIFWKLTKDGTLTISGTGAIPDYNGGGNRTPWDLYREKITAVSIGEGITGIGTYFLRGIHGLTEIVIPASVKYINMGAFENCLNLRTITLNEGLERIGFFAFAGTAISDITLPASVNEMDDGALGGRSNISAYKVAEGAEWFKSVDGVLYTMDGSELVAYPYNRDDDFYTVPEGVEIIWGYAFKGAKITSIVLPDSLTTIGEYAFHGSSLAEIVLPANVEFIGDFAFHGRSLAAARFYGDKPEIGESVFGEVHSSFQLSFRKSAANWAETDGSSFVYYGDVSADGILNENDITLLNQYFAGWKMGESFDEEALDFNTDGESNRKDAMLLARTVAGWPEDALRQ